VYRVVLYHRAPIGPPHCPGRTTALSHSRQYHPHTLRCPGRTRTFGSPRQDCILSSRRPGRTAAPQHIVVVPRQDRRTFLAAPIGSPHFGRAPVGSPHFSCGPDNFAFIPYNFRCILILKVNLPCHQPVDRGPLPLPQVRQPSFCATQAPVRPKVEGTEQWWPARVEGQRGSGAGAASNSASPM
jgi:hypothetical protein